MNPGPLFMCRFQWEMGKEWRNKSTREEVLTSGGGKQAVFTALAKAASQVYSNMPSISSRPLYPHYAWNGNSLAYNSKAYKD